jgi:hypothetical protein
MTPVFVACLTGDQVGYNHPQRIVLPKGNSMQTVDFNVKIPADLAEEAREFDLLNGEEIVALLRDEVDRRVMDMVNREIHDYRAEKAAERDSQHSKSE